MPKLAHRVTMPKPDDPDIITRFADATRKGHPVATAATLAGISRVTAQDWLRLGNEQLDAYDAAPPDAVGVDAGCAIEHADREVGSHAAFASAHREAEAGAVDAHLSVFEEISNKPGHWQRSAWYLERKHAGTFGMRQQHTIEQTRNVNVTISASLGPAQRAALAALLVSDVPQLPAPADET